MYKYLKATTWSGESEVGEEVSRAYLEICFGEVFTRQLEVVADKDGIVLYHNGDSTSVVVALV